jgi:hypothetical protein
MAVKIRTSNPTGRNGIDDLIEQAHRPKTAVPACVAVDDAACAKYASQSCIELWELVLLHSRVDPDFLGYSGFERLMRQFGVAQAIRRLLPPKSGKLSAEEALCLIATRARQALMNGELKPLLPSDPRPGFRSIMEVRAFHAWSSKFDLPVAGPWPKRTDLDGRLGGIRLRFPNRTRLLRQMEELAWSQPAGEWPSNADVSASAIHLGISSENIANAMATILRPDDAPRGRRRRSSVS